jgi:hypothetical protein
MTQITNLAMPNKELNTLNRVLGILLICTIFFSCDIAGKKLVMINNSNQDIFYLLKIDTTLVNYDYRYSKISSRDSIMPLFVRSSNENAWAYKINNYSIDSTLYIYILKQSDVTSYIIDNKLYERKGFSVQDLDSLNWIVRYPEDFK